jgi:hypothetical protein
MTAAEAENKITRLAREELDPRGFKLLHRELADGRVRFLIKAVATGLVCDMIESEQSTAAHQA